MANLAKRALDKGDHFPTLNLRLLKGPPAELPGLVGPDYGVVLFYRGHWCPFCSRHLAEYQKAWPELQSQNIGLAAGSVVAEAQARGTAAELGLTFPLAWGLDADEVSRLTGAFFDPDKRFLHAAGFLLRPGGGVEAACYSTGPIGRLLPSEVLSLVRHYRKQGKG